MGEQVAAPAVGTAVAPLRGPLALAQAAFALTWLARWAAAVGVGLYAYRAGGALAVGLVGALRTLPGALAGPLAAPLADRLRRERVLVAVSLSRAATFAAVAVLVAAGATWPVYALVALWSVLGVLYRPVHSALLPSLCRSARDLAGAQATRSLLDSGAAFAGPLLATVLLALHSLPSVFVASAVLSLAAAACGAAIRYELPPREGGARRLPLLEDLREAGSLVAGDPGLRVLVALSAVQNATRGALAVVTIVLALDVLDAGEAGAGALTTAVGAGAVLGAVGAQLLRGTERLAAWFGTGVALGGLPLVLLSGEPPLVLTGVLLAAAGLGNAVVDIGLFTLPARLVPDEALTRVFTVLETTAALAAAAGSLLAPVALHVLGVPGALVLVGGIGPVVVLARRRALRTLDVAMAALDARVAVLAGVPMLQPLPMPAVERLALRMTERHVPAGRPVVVEGEEGDAFYVVTAGTAEVVQAGRVLRRLVPGDAFGEVALLRAVPRTATVRALEDLGLWELHRVQFTAAVQNYSPSRAEADALMATLHFTPEQRQGVPAPRRRTGP